LGRSDRVSAPFYAISAYNLSGTVHSFINTTDVVAAIEDILGMGRTSKFDYFSRFPGGRLRTGARPDALWLNHPHPRLA
jgi:hypothetical protein